MTQAHIVLDNVRFSHGEGGAAFVFDAAFEPGKITAVMGASGGGKSTLLNLLAGFLRPDSGTLLVNGMDMTKVHPMHRPMSMIFQDHNLFAHLTVAQNVGLGVDPQLHLDATARLQISAALESVGLGGYEKRSPTTLSGGEKQRVALARMLVRERPILLMDEALASLGPGLRQSILALVKELQRAKKLTVIMVTHDPLDAKLVADNVVFLAEQRVICHGSVDEILTEPSDLRVATYLGI
ncbi:MAG: ATP-binding cassette domain-containing protein [Chloroflexota bacterium]